MTEPTGEKPGCLGGKLPTGDWAWQPQNPECAGGADPAFSDSGGGNKRPRCAWFAQCATMTSANKMAAMRSQPMQLPVQQQQQQQVQLPPGVLANAARTIVQGVAQVAQKVPAPLTIPQQAPMMQPVMYQQPQVPVRPQWQVQQQQVQQQYMQQVPPQYGQVPMIAPQQAMMPYAVPQNMVAPGMQMMGYLAVPEPMLEGQHWAARLGFSILRAMFKASGHTVANFFDYTSFGKYTNGG